MSGLKIARGFQLPVDVLTEAIGIVATRGAGKTYTSAVLIEEAHANGVPFVVLDPAGVYHGLRSSHDGAAPGLPVYVFGGPHGDLPLEASAGAFTADLVVDSGHSFVLDLSDMTKRASRDFVAAFLERLYDRKARSRTTLLLVIDEADEFAPQLIRGRGGDAPRCLGAVETITKRGRSRGIGVVLITQRTQALNKDVLDLIETLIAMRQLAKRSRDAVEGWIADKDLRDEAGIIASLQSLPTGTAWVWSPLRSILEKVAVRRIRTFDSYATPKPGETRVEPSARAELDLDALGEQMRATVERAKANDPRELRARVAQLERELAQRPTETTVERVEVQVPVEVPVLDTEHLEFLADAIGELRDIATAVGAVGAVADQIETALRAATARPAPARTPPAPAPPVTRVQEPRPPRSSTPAAADARALKGPQQKVLDALAWYEALGFPQATRAQVAFKAGYKPSGGHFGNVLGGMRTSGLVGYPSDGTVALTDDGRAYARYPDFPGTAEELQQAVLTNLKGPQAKLLRALLDTPGPMTREELAERTGYDPAGGHYGNMVGSLRTLELVVYPERGYVQAAPFLFLEVRA